MAAAVPLALVTLGLALAPPAAAATVTSTITATATSGTAPAGYAYPNANVTISGDVNPSNATYLRSVRLMISTPSNPTWAVDQTYKNTTASGGFTFTSKIPQNDPYARWSVQVLARSAGANTWTYAFTPAVQVTQTHGSEALSMTTFSPKIVETGVQSGVEPAANAGQLARVDFVGGGAQRTIDLQQRDLTVWGDSYWHNLNITRTVAPFESGSWYPQYGFFGGSEYRAIYHYTTGVDNPSPVFSATNITPVFQDEFLGTDLNSDTWTMRCMAGTAAAAYPNGGGDCSHAQTYAKHDWRASYVGGGALVQNVIADPAYGDCNPSDGASRCHVLDSHIASKSYHIPVPTAGHSTWIAARVKFDMNFKGSTSAFWTQADDAYDEHDIAEYFGDDADAGSPGDGDGALAHNTYGDGDGDIRDVIHQPSPAGAEWSDAYHIVATRYRNEGGTLTLEDYVDGKSVGTFPTVDGQTNRWCSSAAAPLPDPKAAILCTPSVPFTAHQRLIMTQTVNDVVNSDSALFGGYTHTTRWDWVQVWTS